MTCGMLQISYRGLEVDGSRRGGELAAGNNSRKYAHKCVSPDTSSLIFPETADPVELPLRMLAVPGHCAPQHLARLPECEHPIDCTAMLK